MTRQELTKEQRLEILELDFEIMEDMISELRELTDELCVVVDGTTQEAVLEKERILMEIEECVEDGDEQMLDFIDNIKQIANIPLKED